MYFLVKDEELLEIYNDIWNKVSNFMKKESYGDVATDFHDKEIPKVGSNYTGLAVILIDFVLKKMITIICKFVLSDNHYLQE